MSGWPVVIALLFPTGFAAGFWLTATSQLGVLGKLERQGLIRITNDALAEKVAEKQRNP